MGAELVPGLGLGLGAWVWVPGWAWIWVPGLGLGLGHWYGPRSGSGSLLLFFSCGLNLPHKQVLMKRWSRCFTSADLKLFLTHRCSEPCTHLGLLLFLLPLTLGAAARARWAGPARPLHWIVCFWLIFIFLS